MHMPLLPDYLGPFEPYDGLPIYAKKWDDQAFTQHLRAMGGTVSPHGKGYLVTQPDGTRRAVIYPELQTTRYYYVLPDGTTLMEHTMSGDGPGTLRQCERMH